MVSQGNFTKLASPLCLRTLLMLRKPLERVSQISEAACCLNGLALTPAMSLAACKLEGRVCQKREIAVGIVDRVESAKVGFQSPPTRTTHPPGLIN